MSLILRSRDGLIMAVKLTTIEEIKPPMASLPTHISANGLNPNIPSSVGSPRFADSCSSSAKCHTLIFM